jgi:hypothetical protein
LLNQIEQDRAANKSAQAALEQERLRDLMERMSVEPPATSSHTPPSRPIPAPLSFSSAPMYPKTNFAGQYQLPSSPPPTQTNAPQTFTYNPSSHGRIPGPASPPPTQSTFNLSSMRPGPASPPPTQSTFSLGSMRPGPASPPPTQTSFSHQAGRYSTYGNPAAMQSLPPQQQQQMPAQQQHASYVPPNFVPPPPPPGPPPLGPQQTIHYGSEYYSGDPNTGRPGSAQQGQGQGQQDPWAGLSAWK